MGFSWRAYSLERPFSLYAAVYRSAETVMGYLPIRFACTLIVIFVIAIIYSKGYGGGSGFWEALRLVC